MSYTRGTAVLQFPSHYIPVEAEEMEYIDGGASNNTYQKAQQAKLRAEVRELTTTQRKALYKQLATYQISYILSAATGVEMIIYAPASLLAKVLLAAGIGNTLYSIS